LTALDKVTLWLLIRRESGETGRLAPAVSGRLATAEVDPDMMLAASALPAVVSTA
jgi:hypothetical protein